MDPFQALRERQPLLLNRSVFAPTYVPAELPGRQAAVERLAGALYPLLQGGAPPNVCIDGPPGSGKSVLARFVLHKLKQNADQAAVPLIIAIIDGHLVNSRYRLLATLANHLSQDGADRVPTMGWPMRDVRNHLDAHLAAREGRLVLFLDHTEALLTTAGEDALDDVVRLERTTLVSTATAQGALRDASPRTHAILAQQVQHLDSYAPAEVATILRERAVLGMRDVPAAPVLDEIVQAAGGHVGRGLELLVEASEVASLRDANRMGVEHVEEARVRLARERAQEALLATTDQERVLLRAVRDTLEASHEATTTTGAAYRAYANLARAMRLDVLSMRRVTGLVDALAARGLVVARVKSRGRYGRSKEISLPAPPDALAASRGPAEA
jgi:archaeal cell division control protein 6